MSIELAKSVRRASRARLAIAGTAIAVLTAPAAASGLAVPGDPDVETVRGNDRVIVAERAELERKLRPPRPEGPFNPLVGAPDYGETDARFGASRSGHVHEGQDMFAATGTPLVAPSDVAVLETGSDGGRGNFINVYDPKLDQSYVYMHMVEPTSFAEGDEIEAGEQLGAVGCTGSCYGEHLHFEIHPGEDPYAEAVDPLATLQRWKSLDKPVG